MKNLVELEVYADEIITEEYVCFGSLFVPKNKSEKLIGTLKDKRCLTKGNSFSWNYGDCPNHLECKEEHHTLNNSEIHFSAMGKNKSTFLKIIYNNWLNFLYENCRVNSKHFYFKITYYELDKLDKAKFGLKNTIENIYNRFFKSEIEGGAKYFFKQYYNHILIDTIYHDSSDAKEMHEYFPWHTGHKINSKNDKKLSIRNENIVFLDSNHRTYINSNPNLADKSQLIQLIDLILGATRQNIYYPSKDPFKSEISMKIRPILKCLLEKTCDSYRNNYRKHATVSFFPKNSGIDKIEKLNDGTIINSTGLYSCNRKLEMPEFSPTQKTLDLWGL